MGRGSFKCKYLHCGATFSKKHLHTAHHKQCQYREQGIVAASGTPSKRSRTSGRLQQDHTNLIAKTRTAKTRTANGQVFAAVRADAKRCFDCQEDIGESTREGHELIQCKTSHPAVILHRNCARRYVVQQRKAEIQHARSGNKGGGYPWVRWPAQLPIHAQCSDLCVHLATERAVPCCNADVFHLPRAPALSRDEAAEAALSLERPRCSRRASGGGRHSKWLIEVSAAGGN